MNADGSLDTSFDGDGTAVIPTSLLEGRGSAVDVSDLGQILVGGSRGDWQGAFLARPNADGSLDSTFSGDGIAHLPGGMLTVSDLLVRADGDVVAAGNARDRSGVEPLPRDRPLGFGGPAIARLNADGSVDTAFGDDGVVTGLVLNSARAGDGAIGPGVAAFQPDGKLLAAGHLVQARTDAPPVAPSGRLPPLTMMRFVLSDAPPPPVTPPERPMPTTLTTTLAPARFIGKLVARGGRAYTFRIEYRGVDVSSLGNDDIVVTGPTGSTHSCNWWA